MLMDYVAQWGVLDLSQLVCYGAEAMVQSKRGSVMLLGDPAHTERAEGLQKWQSSSSVNVLSDAPLIKMLG